MQRVYKARAVGGEIVKRLHTFTDTTAIFLIHRKTAPLPKRQKGGFLFNKRLESYLDTITLFLAPFCASIRTK